MSIRRLIGVDHRLFICARSPETNVVPLLPSVPVWLSGQSFGVDCGISMVPLNPAVAVNSRPPPVKLLKVNPIEASGVQGPASLAALNQASSPSLWLRATQNDPALA